MKLLILAVILPHFFYLIDCQCESLKNVMVTAIPAESENFNVTVNSCIEPKIFDGRAIIGLYVQQQIVPHLNMDSIKDMEQLVAVSFDECSIESVEAGAFKNVPRLSEIYLVKSPISQIPSGVFSNLPALQKIRLNNNSIHIIETEAFASLPMLKKLDVSHNKLEQWNRDWFTGSTALENMNFEFNSIQKIPEYAFKYLTKLEKINFNYNNISAIEVNAFEGVRYLEYLGLRYNRLTVLNFDIFPNPIHVESLFIDANRLNYLPSKTLLALSVSDITLDGNPWNCPCLESIAAWLRLTVGKVKPSKPCKGSDLYQCFQLHYQCSEMVDEEVSTMYFNVAKNRAEKNKIGDYCVRLD